MRAGADQALDIGLLEEVTLGVAAADGEEAAAGRAEKAGRLGMIPLAQRDQPVSGERTGAGGLAALAAGMAMAVR